MSFIKQLNSRRLIYTIGAVVVLAIVVIGVRHFRDSHSTNGGSVAPVPVTADVAARQDVPSIISELGTVQSIDSVSVVAQVTGRIMKIEFTPGQHVNEGQELFLIDPRPFQAALDMQQAQLAHDEGVLAEAQVDLTRYQLLAQENSIAKQQAEDQVYVVQQDKGTVQLDQANIETAQLNLAYCHVMAPVSGRAGELLVDVGNLVGPNQVSTSSTVTTSSGTSGQAVSGAMVTIAQVRPIYVTFNVPQNTLDEIKRYQAAAPLEVDAYSEDEKLLEKGKLTLIDNQVNISSGTVLLQATFANDDVTLWPGEFVHAHLIVSIRKNVVTVPSQAVSAGPNGSYVYVINADKTVHRVNVDVIDRQGSIAVIGNGLSGGENVVLEGQYRLDDGVMVDVQQASASGEN